MKAGAVLLLLTVAGCRGFREPTPELLATVRGIEKPAGPHLRVRARIDIESPWLSGSFEGVVLARTGPSPVVRVQYFPDIGGKVLDMVVRPTHVTAYLPQMNQSLDTAIPARNGTHLVILMGANFLEEFAPLTEERILGERREGGDRRLAVRTVIPGASMTLLLNPDGRIVRRRIRMPSGARWEQTMNDDRSIQVRAGPLTLRATRVKSEVVQSVPDSLFRLEIPPGTHPWQGRE